LVAATPHRLSAARQSRHAFIRALGVCSEAQLAMVRVAARLRGRASDDRFLRRGRAGRRHQSGQFRDPARSVGLSSRVPPPTRTASALQAMGFRGDVTEKAVETIPFCCLDWCRELESQSSRKTSSRGGGPLSGTRCSSSSAIAFCQRPETSCSARYRAAASRSSLSK